MTKTRLLDRQVELLSYLTSSAAIFGDQPPPGPALDGVDRTLLRLEARLSYGKRIEKIIAALPRTFAMLGGARLPMLRAFVDACPPVDINQLANARRFHDFLAACWRHAPPDPYLPEVAACELACATVRADVRSEQESKGTPDGDVSPSGIRRHPRIILLRCAYDVRPLFEGDSWQTIPERRGDTRVVVSVSAAGYPGVFEVTPAVYDLLAGLDDWVDPAALGTTPDADALVRELAEHNFLLVR